MALPDKSTNRSNSKDVINKVREFLVNSGAENSEKLHQYNDFSSQLEVIESEGGGSRQVSLFKIGLKLRLRNYFQYLDDEDFRILLDDQNYRAKYFLDFYLCMMPFVRPENRQKLIQDLLNLNNKSLYGLYVLSQMPLKYIDLSSLSGFLSQYLSKINIKNNRSLIIGQLGWVENLIDIALKTNNVDVFVSLVLFLGKLSSFENEEIASKAQQVFDRISAKCTQVTNEDLFISVRDDLLNKIKAASFVQIDSVVENCISAAFAIKHLDKLLPEFKESKLYDAVYSLLDALTRKKIDEYKQIKMVKALLCLSGFIVRFYSKDIECIRDLLLKKIGKFNFIPELFDAYRDAWVLLGLEDAIKFQEDLISKLILPGTVGQQASNVLYSLEGLWSTWFGCGDEKDVLVCANKFIDKLLDKGSDNNIVSLAASLSCEWEKSYSGFKSRFSDQDQLSMINKTGKGGAKSSGRTKLVVETGIREKKYIKCDELKTFLAKINDEFAEQKQNLDEIKNFVTEVKDTIYGKDRKKVPTSRYAELENFCAKLGKLKVISDLKECLRNVLKLMLQHTQASLYSTTKCGVLAKEMLNSGKYLTLKKLIVAEGASEEVKYGNLRQFVCGNNTLSDSRSILFPKNIKAQTFTEVKNYINSQLCV